MIRRTALPEKRTQLHRLCIVPARAVLVAMAIQILTVGGCTNARNLQHHSLNTAATSSALHTVLALQNESGQDLLVVPRAEPVDWSHAAVGRPDIRFTRPPHVTTAGVDQGVVVFVARPDTSGRVLIEPFYAERGINEYWRAAPSVNIRPLDAVPRCGKELWTAAFFIDGVGAKPTADATVHFLEADGVRYSMRVDAKRNVLRAKPALEFHTFDVHGFDGSPNAGLSAKIIRDTSQRPAIHLVLNQSANGWTGSGASAGLYWFAYFLWLEIAPRDVWRDYVLDDPAACNWKPDK